MPIYAKSVGEFESIAVAPTAAEYGVGPAWIGGRLYYSDAVSWRIERNTPVSKNSEQAPRVVKNLFASSLRYPDATSYGTGSKTQSTYSIGSDGVTGGTLQMSSSTAGRSFYGGNLSGLTAGKFYCLSLSVTAISGTLTQDLLQMPSNAPSIGETNITAAKVNSGGTGRYCIRFLAEASVPILRIGVGLNSNVANQSVDVRDFMIEEVSGLTSAPSEYEYPGYAAAYNYSNSSTVDSNNKVTETKGSLFKVQPYSCILAIGDSRNDEATNIGAQLHNLMGADNSGMCAWHAEAGWTTANLIGPTTKKTLSLTLAKMVSGALLTRTQSSDGNDEMYEYSSGSRYPFDTLAIVDFGVNDVSNGVAPSTIMANFDQIVRAAVSAGMRIVISESNPWYSGAGYTHDKGRATLVLNAMLRNYAITHGHLFVPIWDSFGLPSNHMKLADGTESTTNYSEDGLHLNNNGSTLYAQMIKDAIDADRYRMS